MKLYTCRLYRDTPLFEVPPDVKIPGISGPLVPGNP
ncbi:hypothetical protein LSS_20623 [Leptospira santarosai serovar Shermani str. LT 821]|uniref:Uncharacterized protein n=1 Tax=Leptospira santarosai serovar Shermani str. LT 821 TaxID=758847 RepID=K8XV85_9LEPT|nr:hypothetical protein LSS_20623 [Leptospira santarosai serovar Shermani str. LT 821]